MPKINGPATRICFWERFFHSAARALIFVLIAIIGWRKFSIALVGNILVSRRRQKKTDAQHFPKHTLPPVRRRHMNIEGQIHLLVLHSLPLCYIREPEVLSTKNRGTRKIMWAAAKMYNFEHESTDRGPGRKIPFPGEDRRGSHLSNHRTGSRSSGIGTQRNLSRMVRSR